MFIELLTFRLPTLRDLFVKLQQYLIEFHFLRFVVGFLQEYLSSEIGYLVWLQLLEYLHPEGLRELIILIFLEFVVLTFEQVVHPLEDGTDREIFAVITLCYEVYSLFFIQFVFYELFKGFFEPVVLWIFWVNDNAPVEVLTSLVVILFGK